MRRIRALPGDEGLWRELSEIESGLMERAMRPGMEVQRIQRVDLESLEEELERLPPAYMTDRNGNRKKGGLLPLFCDFKNLTK